MCLCYRLLSPFFPILFPLLRCALENTFSFLVLVLFLARFNWNFFPTFCFCFHIFLISFSFIWDTETITTRQRRRWQRTFHDLLVFFRGTKWQPLWRPLLSLILQQPLPRRQHLLFVVGVDSKGRRRRVRAIIDEFWTSSPTTSL